MYLVHLGTSGNQAFVFATNKLRENLGASELTARATTWWVVEAINDLKGPDFLAGDFEKDLRDGEGATVTVPDWPKVRARFLDATINAPSGKYEIVYATSGVALVLAQTKTDARELVGKVTLRALKEAPGLSVVGSWVETERDKVHEVVEDLISRLDPQVRAKTPTSIRYSRLPIIAPCEVSGMPAYGHRKREGEPSPDRKYIRRSKGSLVKRGQREHFWKRIAALGEADTEMSASILNVLSETLYNFEESLAGSGDEREEWLAVLHADGNGFGQIFSNFGKVNANQGDAYIKNIRTFSISLEECTEQAFCAAAKSLETERIADRDVIMIVPIVLGGDDITVVLQAKDALTFAEAFLSAFRDATSKAGEDFQLQLLEFKDFFDGINAQALGAGRQRPKVPCLTEEKGMGACAGIAIVKPHFPFHAAYDLSEELCKRAKKETKDDFKQPCCAVDFHTVYDSGHIGLSHIESGQEVKASTAPVRAHLTAKPLLIGETYPIKEGAQDGWQRRTLQNFQSAVGALAERDEDGRRRIPATQTHALREALFDGVEAAESQVELVKAQLSKESRLGEVLADGRVFFTTAEVEDGVSKAVERTLFLDALDWLPFEEKRQEAERKRVELAQGKTQETPAE